jgi:ankyrin repeat protein
MVLNVEECSASKGKVEEDTRRKRREDRESQEPDSSVPEHLSKQLRLDTEREREPALPLAPTLDAFRSDPNSYHPQFEWFRISNENAAVNMREVLFASTTPSLPLPEISFGEDRDSALHHCIRYGHYDAARKLILAGALVNVENLKGVTPLLLAAQNGKLGLVKMLQERGANESHASLNGSTAALQAAHFGHLHVVKYVVGFNKELLEQSNEHKTTPLMRASQENHLHVVKFLCEQGASVNRKNLQGMTALMLASQRGNAEICGYLTQQGAELNAMTEQASTSLVLACKRQHLQTVEVLVRAGAELFVKDGRGRTAREICLHRQTSRRRQSSTPDILQKLTALLEPAAQVDLMRLQARKERSFSWIRIWTLLQQDRARLRGVEDRPFHSAVDIAEKSHIYSPGTMAWFRTFTLPAPLVRHIAGFCPLPNRFDRLIALLIQRCSHDANAALLSCFDIIDEVIEEWGFLHAFDQALIPPPGNYPSWVSSPKLPLGQKSVHSRSHGSLSFKRRPRGDDVGFEMPM